MQSMAPEYPIIKAEKIETEVYRAISAILETEQSDFTVAQAYLQIVLARCIGKLNLIEKSNVGNNDLIYRKRLNIWYLAFCSFGPYNGSQ